MGASQVPTARSPQTAATTPPGSPPPAPAPGPTAPPAQILGRYRPVRRLGAGAFGVVWHAHDDRLDREVAIKHVPRERVSTTRLQREIRATARLSHPGIVTLYEAAIDDDGAYLVSELVQGPTLHSLLAAGRLSDHDVVAMAASLCDALAHAHERGVIHRDVKPSNILVPERPTSPLHPAKLTDFGVARVLGGDALTRAGDVIGTDAYMAPEQAEGLEAGPAADLYALALVTLEALTGVNPLAGHAALRSRRLGTHLPPLRRLRRDLPRELGRGIDLALRPRPRERGTLTELEASLRASLPELEDCPPFREQHPHSPAAAWEEGHPPRVAGWREENLPREARLSDRESPRPADAGTTRPRAVRTSWPARATAAVTSAAAMAFLTADLLTPPALSPVAAGVATALITLVLPRLGWLAAVTAIAVTAAAQGHTGAALAVLIAGSIPVAVLPRSGRFWPLPALAPALGVVGLAGAWPAVAGLSSASPWRRAALGVIGWLWLVLATAVAGGRPYLVGPPGLAPVTTWRRGPGELWHGLLLPLAHSGVLLAAPVWGLAALVLPWLLRRGSRRASAGPVLLWSAATVLGCQAAIGTARAGGRLDRPITLVAGAVAAAGIALLLGARGARPRRPDGAQRDAQGGAAGLP